ncbi:MAG TPA: branched-chain amino acid ABC transporter permease [Candidimonas sp.]|nr:branched-chain amino acid ABC transporter permease [Candidimonas sp.]
MMQLRNNSPRAGYAVLAVFVLLLVLLPAWFDRPAVSAFFTQAVIISLMAMAYNMLLGQTGMLSFGHAVYAGLGGYCTIHFLNHFSADGLGVGLLFLPLVGAAAGAFFGLVLGFISTRRSGTAFAMITLGISEMLVQLSLMMPSWSGGEGGVTMDRMLDEPLFGLDFGSALQAYYYILVWAALVVALMYAFTKTPLGRLANAVRDNPERVMFIGFNPQKIRLFVMILSGMFAGIAGALSAFNYEIATSETLGIGQSGMILIATYLGGVGFFFGPIVGAFVYVLFLSVIAGLTEAWLLYFGVLFVLVVLFSPNGLLSLAHSFSEYSARQWLRTSIVILLAGLAVQATEMIYAAKSAGGNTVAASLHNAYPTTTTVGFLVIFLVLMLALRKTNDAIDANGSARSTA